MNQEQEKSEARGVESSKNRENKKPGEEEVGNLRAENSGTTDDSKGPEYSRAREVKTKGVKSFKS